LHLMRSGSSAKTSMTVVIIIIVVIALARIHYQRARIGDRGPRVSLNEIG